MSGSESARQWGTPPRRRRTGLRVALFVVIPIVVVLAVGAVLVGPTIAAVAQDQSVQLTTPAKAGGLTRGADPKVLESLAEISGEYDTKVQAYYEDGERPVVLWGGTTTIWLLDVEIDGFYAELERQGYAVTGRQRQPAGTVGGELECAKTTDADQDRYGVCIWMNHGALLAFLSPQRFSAETVREQVVKMLPDLVTTA